MLGMFDDNPSAATYPGALKISLDVPINGCPRHEGIMILTASQAHSFCALLTGSLRQQEDVLAAALQAAGCERKMEGWVQRGMESWLASNAKHLICLTEYRQLDFVFVERSSVGSSYLEVNTMFEAKFNYASQTGELSGRAVKAADQLRRYQTSHTRADAYLLYVVADTLPRVSAAPNEDRGFIYVGEGKVGRFASGVELMRRSATAAGLGSICHSACKARGWDLHLELFALTSA